MAIREIHLGPRSRVIEQGTGAARDGAEPPVARESPVVPERAGRDGDQPLPKRGHEDVFADLLRVLEKRLDPKSFAAVAPLLEARQAVGIRRYGRSLETFNGRLVHLDLVEELLDGAVYAHQASLERRQLDLDLEAARRAVSDERLHRARAEAEVAALRHNLEQARADISAEQAAVAQLQAELERFRGH